MDLRLPFAAVAALAALPILAMTCRAESGERVVPVVELYTSEGCSSCPPADRWLASAFPPGTRVDVVALAFHVDYWDRLGWSDRFASAAASERQALAARSNAAAFVYTPQVLLQGRDFRGWRRGEIHAALAAAARPAAAKIVVGARVSASGVDAEVSVGPVLAESRVLVALVQDARRGDVLQSVALDLQGCER